VALKQQQKENKISEHVNISLKKRLSNKKKEHSRKHTISHKKTIENRKYKTTCFMLSEMLLFLFRCCVLDFLLCCLVKSRLSQATVKVPPGCLSGSPSLSQYTSIGEE